MSFTMAKGMVAQVAGKHYPAPMTSVVTIEEAARLPRDAALDIERKHFIKLANLPRHKRWLVFSSMINTSKV